MTSANPKYPFSGAYSHSGVFHVYSLMAESTVNSVKSRLSRGSRIFPRFSSSLAKPPSPSAIVSQDVPAPNLLAAIFSF